MNFTTMLHATAAALPPPPVKGGRLSEEAQAKRIVTMRRNRNARWKAAFMALGNRATAKQLSHQLNMASAPSVTHMLLSLQRESPPLVAKIDEVETAGNGYNEYVYQWIGD